jgi:ABC-type lipoprotein export system ATPase subunit
MEVIIKLSHIYKRENIFDQIVTELLSDVNITFEKGKLVGLTGISGTGKSTLLRIILSYDMDFEGSVLINGSDIRLMGENELKNYRTSLGICCPGIATIDPSLTVKENIGNGLKFLNAPDSLLRTEEILSMFGLKSISDRSVLDCSEMDLYRMMLARGICGYPPIVVIDEVLDYFEEDERKTLFETMRVLQKRFNMTMIIVTQDVRIINASDRGINIMNQTTYEIDLDKLRQITASW